MGDLKYPWSKPHFAGKERSYLVDAFSSTWVSSGPYVNRFEEEFARQIKSPYVLTTSNGTTALHAAMLGLGIGSGDEVIIPGFTFVAAVNMAIALGARPVMVDVDFKTWCLDPDAVNKAVTKKTKAICAVHLYGNACDMRRLRAIARRHGIFLIEDAAQAVFSSYKGRYLGTWGDVGTFSFHATKTLAMGEGGCVATRDKKRFKSMKTLSNHGMPSRGTYWHEVVGYNFRLTNLHAAIGLAQLEQSQRIIQSRKRIYNAYHKRLSSVEGITFQVPADIQGTVFWTAAFRVNQDVFKISRDDMIAALRSKGIETRPGFIAVSQLPLYKGRRMHAMPNAEQLGREVISLPSYSQLTAKDIDYICDAVIGLKQ